MTISQQAIAPQEYQRSEWEISFMEYVLGGKQAARLNDIMDVLYDNILGVQRMFTDNVTQKLLSS